MSSEKSKKRLIWLVFLLIFVIGIYAIGLRYIIGRNGETTDSHPERIEDIEKSECVPAGETIFLKEGDTCEEVIKRCCSKRGLCGINVPGIPNYVSCV